jgi:hypothetical protein
LSSGGGLTAPEIEVLRIEHAPRELVVRDALLEQLGNGLLGQTSRVKPDVRLDPSIAGCKLGPEAGLTNGRLGCRFGWLHRRLLGG